MSIAHCHEITILKNAGISYVRKSYRLSLKIACIFGKDCIHFRAQRGRSAYYGFRLRCCRLSRDVRPRRPLGMLYAYGQIRAQRGRSAYYGFRLRCCRLSRDVRPRRPLGMLYAYGQIRAQRGRSAYYGFRLRCCRLSRDARPRRPLGGIVCLLANSGAARTQRLLSLSCCHFRANGLANRYISHALHFTVCMSSTYLTEEPFITPFVAKRTGFFSFIHIWSNFASGLHRLVENVGMRKWEKPARNDMLWER